MAPIRIPRPPLRSCRKHLGENGPLSGTGTKRAFPEEAIFQDIQTESDARIIAVLAIAGLLEARAGRVTEVIPIVLPTPGWSSTGSIPEERSSGPIPIIEAIAASHTCRGKVQPKVHVAIRLMNDLAGLSATALNRPRHLTRSSQRPPGHLDRLRPLPVRTRCRSRNP